MLLLFKVQEDTCQEKKGGYMLILEKSQLHTQSTASVKHRQENLTNYPMCMCMNANETPQKALGCHRGVVDLEF